MNFDRKIQLYTLSILFFISACCPAVEEPAIPDPSECFEEDIFPIPHFPTTDGDVFRNVANGCIPVIYSHGGAPCDIGGMVFFDKHPRVELIGMVLSRGEFHPQIAIEKWPVFLYDVLGSTDTALGLGTEAALDPNPHDFPEVWRVGSDDFWGLTLPPQVTDINASVGHELIVDLVKKSPDKVTIVAMASMTDIALALQMYPRIIDNIAHVVIMGGAFNMRGNLDDGPEPTTNEAAEWNMFIDSEAARYIFNSGVAVSVVPLDATQYCVTSENISDIKTIADPSVKYVEKMWRKQWDWANGEFFIWDTIAATAVTNPENFYWTVDGIDVITEVGDFQGQTIALNNGAQHTRFATGADYRAIMALLFETFRGETSPGEMEDPF